MCGGGVWRKRTIKDKKGRNESCGLSVLSVNPDLGHPLWGHDGMSAGAAGPGLPVPTAPAVPHTDALL